MAAVSTDYVQEVDAASTPKIAPTTPLQVLQKPQQTAETINAFPSLTLVGRAELMGSSNKPLSVLSTPLKLQDRILLDNQKGGPQQDENLGFFCLSKYEKEHPQTPGMASHLYNHMGPLHPHAGHLHTAAHTSMAHLDTQCLSQRFDESQWESPTLVPKEKFFPATGEAGAASGSAIRLVSPTPGEVALDAYELYSKMFPSTYAAITEHSSPATDDPEVGRHAFLDQMNNMQLLRSVSHSRKPLVWDMCERIDDLLESEKKMKFAKMKEEDTPGRVPIPPESMSTMLCASNSCKMVQSGRLAGHVSAEEGMSTQPAVGLKLYTSTACMQMPTALPGLSAREPSISLSSEPFALGAASKAPDSSTDTDWGRYLALSATPARNGTELAIMRPFQERFKELQAFLKQCDVANRTQYIQALRTLSGAARSGYAVELETRAIRLSLEEGKEMKRMRLLNVLGRISERNLDMAGATPHGPRLPAPGASSTPHPNI